MKKINKKVLISLTSILILIGVGSYFLDYKYFLFYLQAESDPVINYDGVNFAPKKVIVFKGTTVTFKNSSQTEFWPASNIHPLNDLYPGFDAKTRIASGSSWTFKFDKPGAWDYHDHLNPKAGGTIMVIEKTLWPQNNSCRNFSRLTYNERQTCWYFEMKEIIETKGINAAFDHLAYLFTAEPTFAGGCHDVTHLIGAAAYEEFAKGKQLQFEGDTSYCGYGFYHGFIEAMLFSTEDYEKAQEFCESAGSWLQGTIESPNATYSCYHGMGHAMFDIHDPSLWGEEERMIKPALKICEETTEGLEEEKRKQCATGIFNALGIAYSNDQYDLTMNAEDPVWVCRIQAPLYQKPCFTEVAMAWISREFGGLDFDFEPAARFVNSINDPVGEPAAASSMASEYTRVHRSEFSAEKMAANCDLFEGPAKESCVVGVTLALMNWGLPGEEYKEVISFCESEFLSPGEEEVCFGYFLPRLITLYPEEKSKEICAQVDEEHQHLCR